MQRKDITREDIRRATARSAEASSALERRTVPPGFVRSAQADRFLATRKHQS